MHEAKTDRNKGRNGQIHEYSWRLQDTLLTIDFKKVETFVLRIQKT